MENPSFYTKKSLGQHFLTSEGAVDSMVTASDAKKGDTVLEIGPGKGVLTVALLKTGASVVAVEKDSRLIEHLGEKFADEIAKGKLTVLEDDALLFDPKNIKKDYKLVANIPYYITGEIIRTFLTTEHKPVSMTLLVQKEVAERIVAKDGKESVLSLSVKFFGTPTYIQTVKRGSFNPPPNVDSAIIHIADIVQRGDVSEETFFTTIKAGFSSKRKKLISNLSAVAEKDVLQKAFADLSLSENTRAEDLPLTQWIALVKNIS